MDLILYENYCGENYDGIISTNGNEWYLPIDKVVEFKAESHSLVITELCDEYFSVKLDKENAQKFVDSLQAIVSKL